MKFIPTPCRTLNCGVRWRNITASARVSMSCGRKFVMPDLFSDFFHSLYTMPLSGLALWTLLENTIIFVVCLVAGYFLVLRYQRHPVTEAPPPLTWMEIFLAIDCV